MQVSNAAALEKGSLKSSVSQKASSSCNLLSLPSANAGAGKSWKVTFEAGKQANRTPAAPCTKHEEHDDDHEEADAGVSLGAVVGQMMAQLTQDGQDRSAQHVALSTCSKFQGAAKLAESLSCSSKSKMQSEAPLS